MLMRFEQSRVAATPTCLSSRDTWHREEMDGHMIVGGCNGINQRCTDGCLSVLRLQGTWRMLTVVKTINVGDWKRHKMETMECFWPYWNIANLWLDMGLCPPLLQPIYCLLMAMLALWVCTHCRRGGRG